MLGKLARYSLPKALVDAEESKEGEEVEITVRKVSDIRFLHGRYAFKNLQREKEDEIQLEISWRKPGISLIAMPS